ncbi:MAG: LytR C-terminal domain-containing protein [Pseudomonadales bacterium]|nr:LytR C-terminal domain-containing protein [Candidatus Woesebacteria bacterium]MCB9801139.1 LytR C-terminal domain-containing protein [Pseudomonadales bacterium]
MDGKIVLAHFGNDQRDSRVFVIKGEERVEVPNGYGEYAIGVVPALLSVDNQSDETIRSVMSRILGVPVDELVVTDPIVLDEAQEDSDAEIENSVSFFFASNIASVLRTLSRENVIKNPSKAVMLLRVSYLASTQTSQRVELSSYQETSAFLSGEKMMDLSPAEQKCSIAVINSTESTGLAHETAQMLESNGAYIVREDSISNVSEATHIEIGDQPRAECENLARKLKAFFPESLETGVQTEDSKRYRADIVLLLGLDVVTAHK